MHMDEKPVRLILDYVTNRRQQTKTDGQYSWQRRSQDFCKLRRWSALQQKLTTFSRYLLLQSFPSLMFVEILVTPFARGQNFSEYRKDQF